MKLKKIAAVIVASATTFALAGAVSASPGISGGTANAAAPTLPKSPAGRVSVLSANAGELLNGKDIAEVLDVAHLAYRVQVVLNALNGRSPAIPNYAPDIVLLQEVTKESAANVVAKLTAETGYTYAIGSDALPGTVAWEDKDSYPRVVHETAIAYNTATMATASSPAASLLAYPESQIPAGQSRDTWWSMRQSTVELRQKSSGTLYGVYSTHYRPNLYVTDHDGYTTSWTNFLKTRLGQIYPGAIPIIGGDFNNVHNAHVAALQTATAAGPNAYHVAQPEGSGSVDAIASTLPLLTTNHDYDYKTINSASPTYFASTTDFTRCAHLYDGYTTVNPGGEGGSAAAKAIHGCNERYYSDHDFLWAVFGS